ncbi:AraC family transcriptional regulator [Chitinimonas lacunae]|uniref:AraC family transcriptional regulator n=1 Tax=Chitinimonas lacunae TaxID=1963018 RepID=A0ABV8MVY3_9NEIS
MPTTVCASTPAHPPRVVAPYAHTLLDAARAAGVATEVLLRAAGLERLAEADVSVPHYLAMLAAAVEASGDPLFGWRLGGAVKPTTYGVNGILILACPTLGDALEQVLRFECLVHDLGRSTLERDGERAIYRWRNDWAGHPQAGVLAESVFAGIRTCAQWLVGQPLAVSALYFAAADPGPRAGLAELAQAPVHYGARENRAEFPAALLDLPIPQANNTLLPLLQRHAEALLAQRHPQVPPIVGQVRQAILARLGQESVRLADIATDLALSPRTLQRRLGEAGVAFQQLHDAIRHELARHYLETTDMPIGEIGYVLGFQDPAAFHHAFRAWQGDGPGRYRELRRVPA